MDHHGNTACLVQAIFDTVIIDLTAGIIWFANSEVVNFTASR